SATTNGGCAREPISWIALARMIGASADPPPRERTFGRDAKRGAISRSYVCRRRSPRDHMHHDVTHPRVLGVASTRQVGPGEGGSDPPRKRYSRTTTASVMLSTPDASPSHASRQLGTAEPTKR